MPTQDNTPDHVKANGLNLAQRVVLQSAVLGKLYAIHKEERRELEKQMAERNQPPPPKYDPDSEGRQALLDNLKKLK